MKTSIDWRGRVALFLAAALACLGAVTVVAPAPAQAATSIRYCFPLWIQVDEGVWIKKLICIDVPLAYNPDWFHDYGIDLRTDVVLPLDVQERYVNALADGLNLVGQAQRARDPLQAASLRSKAQQSFLTVASVLDGQTLALKQVGTVDLRNQRLDPSPNPWLERAATDITDGVANLQLAMSDPRPDPWLEAAMQEFEIAYDQLEMPVAG
jgi:hypothetical protein